MGFLKLYFVIGAGQKISPDGKAKIQLQLVLHTGESTTFHFSNESSALKDRDAAKELLQQLLPKFKKKANKELEEKNRWDCAHHKSWKDKLCNVLFYCNTLKDQNL